jgi:hypothetical protein
MEEVGDDFFRLDDGTLDVELGGNWRDDEDGPGDGVGAVLEGISGGAVVEDESSIAVELGGN